MLGMAAVGELTLGQPDDNGQPPVVTPMASSAVFSWSLSALAEFTWSDDNGQIAQFYWE